MLSWFVSDFVGIETQPKRYLLSIAMVILCWKKIFNFRDAIHIENILRSFKWDIEFPSTANFSVKIR